MDIPSVEAIAITQELEAIVAIVQDVDESIPNLEYEVHDRRLEDLPDDIDVEAEAKKIVVQSREMGDHMAERPPEGQTCARCERDAVRGPGDEWFCREHQEEFFKERHG